LLEHTQRLNTATLARKGGNSKAPAIWSGPFSLPLQSTPICYLDGGNLLWACIQTPPTWRPAAFPIQISGRHHAKP